MENMTCSQHPVSIQGQMKPVLIHGQMKPVSVHGQMKPVLVHGQMEPASSSELIHLSRTLNSVCPDRIDTV